MCVSPRFLSVILLLWQSRETGAWRARIQVKLCVMVGAGVKANPPLGQDSDGYREEKEVNAFFESVPGPEANPAKVRGASLIR
jgi:hypothetical protein